MPDTGAPIPDPSDFFLKVGLYEWFRAGKESWQAMERILEYDGALDAYCPSCGQKTVFSGRARPTVARVLAAPSSVRDRMNRVLATKVVDITFPCTRDLSHRLVYCVLVDGQRFGKIGQYPSLADLQMVDSEKYRKILGNQYRELTRAIGLRAHGIGTGAFVYLRRIFEALLEQAHARAQTDAGWNEETYSRVRVLDKIELLRHHLPEFMVENRSAYGILSKGIHELDEETCLAMFQPVRLVIEMMLDEALSQQERTAKREAAEQAMRDLHNQARN